MAEFVINDQARINSHGFRLLNAGARLERYEANPVVLHQHDSCSPIGVGTKIRTEGDCMIFTPDFDLEDPLAAAVARKVEKGYLKGCSPGIIVHKMEAELLPDGSEKYSATDWELCEISIVSVPSNAGAVRLYNDEMQELSLEEITKLCIRSTEKNTMMNQDVKTITITQEARQALSLSSCELQDGKELSAAVLELSARLKAAEQQNADAIKLRAASLVDEAVTQGKIAATAKDRFVEMAVANYDLAKETLAGIPARASLSAQLLKMRATPEREGWKYLDWAKKDPEALRRMKQEDPDAFAELQKKR